MINATRREGEDEVKCGCDFFNFFEDHMIPPTFIGILNVVKSMITFISKLGMKG